MSEGRAAEAGRIHVVAPAWAIDAERVEAGVAWLRDRGFEVVLPPAVRARHRYLAGDDATRAAALRAALDDPEAQVVWVAQGGYGSTRLLPFLDPVPLARHPRLLVGFSDATALHALWHRAGLATIHGPNLSNLASWEAPAQEALLAMLAGEAGPGLEGAWDHPSPVGGRLLGGNLSLLAAMAGTGALPDTDGAMLLLEDVDERTYRLDRYVQQLVQAGVLRGVSAVVLGQFTRCRRTRGDDADAETILREVLAPLACPVLSGVAVGHEDDAWPLWLGRRARIEPAAAGRGVLRVEG